MSVIEIPADSFIVEVEEAREPIVMEFWRKTCEYCKKFNPIYEKLPEIFDNKIKFFKMEMLKSLENLRLAEGFGVEETPALKFFCLGKEIGEIVGYRSLEEVVKEIKEVFRREEYCRKVINSES
jgi:thiol-disulfide isomerase/thioredoxin